jgi:Ca2+/Na+ antiporter
LTHLQVGAHWVAIHGEAHAGDPALLEERQRVDLAGAPNTAIFVLSGLALVSLAWIVGVATEQLAESSGPKVGGVLNATFGNAAELIITIFAIRAGQLEVATASITGSILGNLLFVGGLSMLVGGWGRDRQRFRQDEPNHSVWVERRGATTVCSGLLAGVRVVHIPQPEDAFASQEHLDNDQHHVQG